MQTVHRQINTFLKYFVISFIKGYAFLYLNQMSDQSYQAGLSSQINTLKQGRCLKKAHSCRVKSWQSDKKQRNNPIEQPFDDELQLNPNNQSQYALQYITDSFTNTIDEPAQISRAAQIGNSKYKLKKIESGDNQQTKVLNCNEKVILQEKRKKQTLKNKHSEKKQSTFQSCNREDGFQSNLKQFQRKHKDFPQQAQKISLQQGQKQQKQKQAKPRTKTNQLIRNKQNFCQDEVFRKKYKCMKKVAFQDQELQYSKQSIKLSKNINNTSIIVDQFNSEFSRTSIFLQKTNSKLSKGSLKLLSQHGSYRFLKVVNQQQHLPMMVKQVQLRNEQMERREDQLYKISHQNKHSNIVYMFSKHKLVRDNKRYLQIRMELYRTNLNDYLNENEQSSRTEIQRKIILFQIMKALSFIHAKNIYHRDLCLTNIMVGQRLKVALTNFAYLQSFKTDQYSEQNYYQCNSFIRPPEIILNPMRPFDKGADIWALGCIIVFMLKGKWPFMENSDADIFLQIMKFVGKPSLEFLQSIRFKQQRRFIFPDLPLLSIKQFFNCQDDALLNILKSIFVYESQRRPTAQNLLANPYFQYLRDQLRFNHLKKAYDIEDLFDFSSHQLSRDKRKQIIPGWYNSK